MVCKILKCHFSGSDEAVIIYFIIETQIKFPKKDVDLKGS